MISITFASHNHDKVEEIRAILEGNFLITGLHDLGCHEDIPEPYDTLEANALTKARYVYNNYSVNCFADDTGLEVDALNGLPGVLSARYAGQAKDNNANINKLLYELEGRDNRQACFRTVIALIIDGETHLFEGKACGHITDQPRGTNGFGYDPVFVPDGYRQTFAEMDAATKNKISHRYRALQKLAEFLQNYRSTLS